MKTIHLLFLVVLGIGFTAHAADKKPQETPVAKTSQLKDGSMPLVFDPLTKKYFVGGTSRFMLKQSEQSTFVERIEVSVDGAEYIAYNGSIQFPNEGKHTLKFRAIGTVNNWSPVQFIEVFVDMTHPTTEYKFLQDKFYAGANNTIYIAKDSSLNLVAQDNLSGIAAIEYSFDGSNFSTYSKPIQFDKSGKHTVYYRSSDRVGNEEPIKSMTLIVDSNPPTSTMALQGSAKPTNINKQTYISDSMAFAITASDEGSDLKQIWVALDGKPPIPYIKPLYFLQEGHHNLKYYGVDNVGNKEVEKELSFYTVSIPARTVATPLSKVVNTGGVNYSKTDFQLKLDAADNVVGVDRIEYKLDQDTAFKTYIEPIRFKTNGYHTISYQSVDRAGNIEPTKSYTVHITEDPPSTAMATAQPLVVKDGVTYSPAPNILTFNVSNSPVGIQHTMVSINDGPYTTYQGPLTLGNDHKTYKISYKSIDRLGNEEVPKIVSLNMISAIPVVDLFISNGQSNEERVRTNYLENADAKPAAVPAGARQPSATALPPKKK